MPDNLVIGGTATGLPSGERLGTLKGSWSGDTDAHVGPVALMNAAGTEGSWVFSVVPFPVALGASGGLKVHIAGDDVGTISETDDGSIAGAQANLTPTLGLPYIWGGGTWVRGGFTPYHLRSAATNNATNVKGTAGILGYITCSNINASPRYLKFYNKATAPAPGSDTPVATFLIPGNTSGAGSNIPLPPNGMAFSTGISFAIVAGESDTDNTSVAAGDLHLNLGWL